MKFTVSQKDLAPLLQQCHSVADSRSTMPILGNVLVTANGKLTLAATDLYQAVTADVSDAKIATQGTVAVEARALFERIKMLPGDITFTLTGSSLVLKSGSRRFTIPTVAGSDFPELPKRSDAAVHLTIAGDDLAALIRRVSFAVSPDETRMHLNSLLLIGDGETLTAVATDGHRLSVAKKAHPSIPFRELIPLKGMLQLLKLCDDAEDGTVLLTNASPMLFIGTPHYDGSIKGLGDSVQYPPYEQVIPTNLDGRATTDRLSLLSALKAVSVAASDRTGGVKLSFGGEAIKLSSESPEGGESMDEIACEYSGPGGDVGVNARYLIEALGAIEGERVVVSHGGELDPMTIKAEGDESGSVSVVMPMRV